MSNEDRLSGRKLIKVKRWQYKASGQKEEDEEGIIVRFKSQTGFGGRFVSGMVRLVWEEWRNDCGDGLRWGSEGEKEMDKGSKLNFVDKALF